MNQIEPQHAGKPERTFWRFLADVSRRPLASFGGSPLAQSAAAFGINVWFLVIAVLAQFWVILSALLLLAQFYNTWLAYKGKLARGPALAWGFLIVAINFAALGLAVLGQFWVVGSLVLSVWQYVSLLRICFGRRQAA